MTTHDPIRRAALLARPDWVPAVYAGLCGRCGTPFGSGAAIFAKPEGALGWRAECCADPALWRPAPPTDPAPPKRGRIANRETRNPR